MQGSGTQSDRWIIRWQVTIDMAESTNQMMELISCLFFILLQLRLSFYSTFPLDSY